MREDNRGGKKILKTNIWSKSHNILQMGNLGVLNGRVK